MAPDVAETPSEEQGSEPARQRGRRRSRARQLSQALNPFDGVPPPVPVRERPVLDEPVTPAQERAMRNLWWDGFFAESSETIWLQYFALYALAFGAETWLIGLLSAVGGLLAAASMWPGAHLAERTRRYKRIVLLTGGGAGRLLFLVLVAVPWLASGEKALGVLLAVAMGRGFFGSVAMPAWSAFAAEFVPPGLRGRYFGSRNFARQVAGLVVAPVAGLLIQRVGGLEGWQLAWALAFVLGAVATAFYARIPSEAAVAAESAPTSSAPARPAALSDPNLLWLTATMGLFHTSVMLAGPFFSVYLVSKLDASVAWVGVTAAAVPVGGIVAQPLVGQMNDRLGAKWLLVTSGLLLPLLPWFWMVVTEPWHVIFINLAAGALWGANLLATFNLTLAIAPSDRRATYSAVQQGAVFVASAVGPLIGGPLIGAAGYRTVFFLSGLGRLVATALLARMVQERVVGPRPALAE
jgi:MFS family permease